jgi:thiol-disulfide isomerase/thioredoxin
MAQHIHAPEFPTDLPWLNTTRPLSLKALKGQIVVLDFWTYCCINCIHILPDLFGSASFRQPQGLCYLNDFLYVCDTENHTLREVDLESETVLTIAGTGELGRVSSGYHETEQQIGRLEKGDALEQALNSPWDVVAKGRSLYLAMAGSHQLCRYDLDKQTMEVFAGSGRENIADGPRLDAQLAQPSGLSMQGDFLYFADSEVSAVRRVNLATDEVETLVGSGLFDFGHIDGPLKNARLQHALGLFATDKAVYIADTYNHAIRRIDLGRKQMETLVSRASQNTCRIGEEACEVLPLFEPNGVWLHGSFLYIADTNNHLIRVFDFQTAQLKTVDIK